MSRIGNKPIEIPAGIDVKVEGNTVTVSGKGITLSQTIDSRIGVKMDGNVMHITRANEEKETKSMHGLYRALIHNMVEGIDKGFSRASNMSTRLSSARKVKPARVNKEGGVSEWLQKLIARRTVLKDAPEYAAKCTVLPSVPDWPFSAPPTTFMLRSSMMILA